MANLVQLTLGQFEYATAVRNGVHRVVVSARYADLVRNQADLELTVDFKSHAQVRTLAIHLGPTAREGSFLVANDMKQFDCDLTGSVDYGDDTIRVVMPHRSDELTRSRR